MDLFTHPSWGEPWASSLSDSCTLSLAPPNAVSFCVRPRLCLCHEESLTGSFKALSSHVPKIRKGRGSQDEQMENLNSVFSRTVMPPPPRARSCYSEEKFWEKRQPARIPRRPGLWEGKSTALVTSYQLKQLQSWEFCLTTLNYLGKLIPEKKKKRKTI